jgi:hypothetical protein
LYAIDILGDLLSHTAKYVIDDLTACQSWQFGDLRLIQVLVFSIAYDCVYPA